MAGAGSDPDYLQIPAGYSERHRVVENFNPHAIGILNLQRYNHTNLTWLLSKIFENIFHNPNLIEEHECKFLSFFAKIRHFDFRKDQIR